MAASPEVERWKPTEADLIRLTLHRTWFSWPAWVYFAIYEEWRYDQMLYNMKRDFEENGGT